MNNKLICFGIIAGGLAACGQSNPDIIRLNQVGYFPQQEKVAVADTVGVTEFTVVNADTGAEVLKGSTQATVPNPWSSKTRLLSPVTFPCIPGRSLFSFSRVSRVLLHHPDASKHG